MTRNGMAIPVPNTASPVSWSSQTSRGSGGIKLRTYPRMEGRYPGIGEARPPLWKGVSNPTEGARMALPENISNAVAGKQFWTLATVNPDGTPQATVVWVQERDG